MKDNRPVFLNLIQIRLPITAFISILHRVSGVILFLLIPAQLYILQRLLTSKEQYNNFMDLFAAWPVKSFFWILSMAVVYHTMAGIRHLIMDTGRLDSLGSAKISSVVLLLVMSLFGLYLGYKLW